MATTHDFEGFAHAHAQRLGRTAWLLTGNHHAAEDLVQDTLTKLYVQWARVTRADDPVRYARATMLNTFISGRRRRSSTERPTADVPERLHQPDHNSRVDLLRALDTLTALDRTILVLRFFEDMSPPDVGGQLGLTSGAVRTRTTRALAKIRPLLSDAYAPAGFLRPAPCPTQPGRGDA